MEYPSEILNYSSIRLANQLMHLFNCERSNMSSSLNRSDKFVFFLHVTFTIILMAMESDFD